MHSGTPKSEARPLRFVDATLYVIVLVTGLNWLAVAGAVGPGALPLWGLAALTFFLPLSVASAELAQRFTGEGGLYVWAREMLGPLPGFLCGWLYWFSLMPFFAGVLFFQSGQIARLAGIGAGNAHIYLAISVVIVCVVTAIELAGFRFGKWLTNFGATGMWLVFGIAVVAALVLVGRGASATDFAHASFLPKWNFDTAIFWGTMVFGFAGPESVGFLRNEIAGGSRTLVRVLAVAGVSIALIYIAGTAVMLAILPQAELTRLGGFPDALRAGLARIGAGGLAPPVLALLVAAYLGGFAGWFGVGARLPLAAGIDHFLPGVFAHRNPRTGAPTASILLQGALTLACVFLSQAGESVSGTYDILIAMSVLTASLPYVFVFAAYVKFARENPPADAWRPPGGARTSVALAFVGQAATLIAITCALVPGSSEHHPLAAFLKIVLPTLGMTFIGLLVYAQARRRANIASGMHRSQKPAA
jgi:amino acid transporter